MKPYLRVTLAYAAFGIAWIVFSDRLVEQIAVSKEQAARVQTYKGALFVTLSSLLILWIARRAFEEQRRVEQEKLAVFNKTVEGSYHILLNYLNQMQLVTMEAEQCAGFDIKVLEAARTASDEATTELMKLREVQTVTAADIDAVIYHKLRPTTKTEDTRLTPTPGA